MSYNSKYTGQQVEALLDKLNNGNVCAMIDIAGDMTSQRFNLTSEEWRLIYNAFNSNQVVMLRCKTPTPLGSGYFMPNIHIEQNSSTLIMYLTYNVANSYGQVVSYYNVNTATIIQTSTYIESLELKNGAYFPSYGNAFAQIGYTLMEEVALFGPDIDYSKMLQEKWSNGELKSFKNDAKLIYPPMVDVGDKTDLSQLYYKCINILTIPALKTADVTNMAEMFAYCASLRSVLGLDTSSAEDMESMFYNCSLLESVSRLNTINVTNMAWMFGGCGALATIPDLDCENVKNTSNMFNSCLSLKFVQQLNTQKVTNMKKMFSDCIHLERIEGLDFRSVTDIMNIFYNCNNLKYIKVTNLGKSPLSFINLSEAANWGVGSDENRQSVIDSLLTYSYDRTSNGMEQATVRLSTTTKALLTESELSAISAKGYEIVAY